MNIIIFSLILFLSNLACWHGARRFLAYRRRNIVPLMVHGQFVGAGREVDVKLPEPGRRLHWVRALARFLYYPTLHRALTLPGVYCWYGTTALLHSFSRWLVQPSPLSNLITGTKRRCPSTAMYAPQRSDSGEKRVAQRDAILPLCALAMMSPLMPISEWLAEPRPA